VDIGVHQDGLVHVSQLADRFVKDPHEVVKAGDVVRVRVVEVDVARKRIGLSMRKSTPDAQTAPEHKANAGRKPQKAQPPKHKAMQEPRNTAQGALGEALRNAMRGKT
jgi:uncharacterized protein